MDAHAAYAVFTARTDDPPATLLRDAGVPRLDPDLWSLGVRDLGPEDPLVEVLRHLAFEREPPIPRRQYPTPHLYRRAVTVQLARADSLYPDATAFLAAAVAALLGWAGGPVVDLTAERVWTPREWRRRFGTAQRRRPFVARDHVSVHASWAADGRSATLHTHGMAKFAHPDFVALDVPDEGTRAVGQLLGHLATVRAMLLEPLLPGHAFDPGFGQPMVAFLPVDPGHPVLDHLGAPPSVVTDYDVAADEAIDGLYELLRTAKALDRPVPDGRRRHRLAALRQD